MCLLKLTSTEEGKMKKTPLVSVIVPTFNHEQFIRQALDSVLMQKVDFAYEILVGDDDSTDSTPAILQEYQEKYPDIIRLWLRPKNIGASRNAYELLLKAEGKYLATCEGDDYWTDNKKLQRQIDFLETHSEYVGCTHKFRIVDENGKIKKHGHLSWIKRKKRFSGKDFAGMYLPGQPSTFVRRNIIREHPDDYTIFYKADPLISDRTAMMRFLGYGDFYCMDAYMSCYRQVSRRNSLTVSLYKNNENHAVRDYRMHQILKQDAEKRGTAEKYRLDKRDIQLFADLWVCSIKNKNAEAKRIANSIVKAGGHPTKYYLFLMLHCVKKLFHKVRTYI